MKIEVIKGDITELDVDAIVDPANSYMTMGGGLSGVIRKKGGDIIRQEAEKYAPIPVGKAIITSAGNLKAKYVIHAPTMKNPAERIGVKNVELATQAVLDCCEENKIDNVAIPGLGTGVGNVPEKDAAEVMVKTIKKFKGEHPKKVILIGFEQELYEAFKKEVIR